MHKSHIFVVYLRKHHIALSMINRQKENEFAYLREENEELKQHVFQLESKLFIQMDSYLLIEQKSKIKCFSPNEIQQLYADINYVYILSIKMLKSACSSLTEEDIMFCCLSKLHLGNTRLGHSMGCASRQAVNQRRYRIKKKMKEARCDYLFDLIFQLEIRK